MSSTEVTTQTPAGWVALSAGGRHLVVQGPEAVADDLRGALESGVVEVLEALSRDGLGALPDFALVDTSGEQARVVVRGAAVVRVDGADVGSDGRMPWRDLDVSAAVIELTASGGRGGWRRPKRLGRPVAAAAPPAADPEAEPAPQPPPVPAPDAVQQAEEQPEAVAEQPTETTDDVERDAEPDAVPDAERDAEREAGSEVEPEEPADNQISPAFAPSVPPVPPVPPADLTLPPSEEYAGAAPAERVTPEPAPKAEKKVLIDSVPWRTLPDRDRPAAHPAAQPEAAAQTDAADPAAPVTPQPAPVPAPARSADDAPAPPSPGEPVPLPADGPTGPDNWGLTGPPPIPPGSTEEPEPAAPEPERPVASAPPVPDVTMDRSALNPASDGPVDSPIVLAVICPAGHHSSPHASTCRVCGRDIPTQQPFQTPRPQLGVFRVSTGGLVPLDRGILLGRSPKVNADLPPSSRPHLVRLASRDNDISRNHAEVILEGWHVLIRDLGSTNGTTVTLPGQEPVRLRPTEDFGIEPGAVVTLADEVALTYEASE